MQHCETEQFSAETLLPMYVAQADIDLRPCDPNKTVTRCSYYKVFYDDEASFITDKINEVYFSNETVTTKFKPKVAIVQVSRHLFAPTRRTRACVFND